MTGLRAVLFDLDGTLLDTAPDFVEVIRLLRLENGLSELPVEEVRSHVSHGARALVTLALGLREGDADFEPARQRLLDLYQGLLGRFTSPFPGIIQLLTHFGERGLDWGIVTNKPAYLTNALLDHMQLSPAPGSVVCPDHVSRTKPDPEPILLACSQLNCRVEDTVYVGDHIRDIEAGRSAGMRTIAAGYGYLAAGEDIATWQADQIAEYSESLLDLLTNPW